MARTTPVHRRRRQHRHYFAGDCLEADERFEPLVLAYARNLLVGTSFRHLRPKHFGTLENFDLVTELALSVLPARARARFEGKRDRFCGPPFAAALKRYAQRARRTPSVMPAAAEPLGANLEVMARLLHLDDVERDLLQFVLVLAHSSDLRAFGDSFDEVALPAAAALAGAAIGRPASAASSSRSSSATCAPTRRPRSSPPCSPACWTPR